MYDIQEAVLENKINSFLKRKSEQYPELNLEEAIRTRHYERGQDDSVWSYSPTAGLFYSTS